MRSRWNDAEAAALSGVDLLVYASRLVGAETSLVVWGGGNTSIKTRERDHRGREIPVLRVKGSGSDLKSIQKKDFPGVRMDDVLALLERAQMDDQAMVDYFAHALLEPASPRPSIETPLHGFLPAPAVIHTHADAIVSLTNNDRCHEVLRQVYGDDVIAVHLPQHLVAAVVVGQRDDGVGMGVDHGGGGQEPVERSLDGRPRARRLQERMGEVVHHRLVVHL